MIKNIIFDLSEVIITGYFDFEELLWDSAGIPKDSFLSKKKLTLDKFFDLMRGRITEDEYWEIVLSGETWNVTVEDLKTKIREHLGQMLPGMEDIIKNLSSDYNLVLLSDYPKEWKEDIIHKIPILDYFNQKFFSCDFGKLKNDDGTFDHILKETAIKPEETIFIDDSPQNVRRAEQTGIIGIVFEDAEKLKNDLAIIQHLLDQGMPIKKKSA